MPTEGLRIGKIKGQTQAKCIKKCEVYIEHGRAGIWHGRAGGQHAQEIEHGYATSLDHATRPCQILARPCTTINTTMQRPLSYRHGRAQVKHDHAKLKSPATAARLGLGFEESYKRGAEERKEGTSHFYFYFYFYFYSIIEKP